MTSARLDLALDQARAAALEPDPTFVETVEHLDARNRVTHSLGAKDRVPVLARNGLGANRTVQRLRELRGDPVLGSPTPGLRARRLACHVQPCRNSSAAHACRRPRWRPSARPLSRGCRKEEMTPWSRAWATSQLTFSMNQAGPEERDGQRQRRQALLPSAYVGGQQVRLRGLQHRWSRDRRPWPDGSHRALDAPRR